MPAALFVVPASRPGWKGGTPPEGQPWPSGPVVIWKELSRCSGTPRIGVGVEVGGDGVGAAGRRRHQRAALALAEAEVEVAEGELGDVVDFGGQLAGQRVRGDLQRLFDEHAEFGVAGDHVDRQQVVVGVLRPAGRRRGSRGPCGLRSAGFRFRRRRPSIRWGSWLPLRSRRLRLHTEPGCRP